MVLTDLIFNRKYAGIARIKSTPLSDGKYNQNNPKLYHDKNNYKKAGSPFHISGILDKLSFLFVIYSTN